MATKSDQNTVDTVNPEHEHLIEVLKFTPCTYSISMWGYGGEYVMGTVDRKIYDYFRQRRLSLSDFAWDSDYAEINDIPEDMWPFPPGSWYECDNISHVCGVDRSAGTLQICDQQGNVVYEKSLEDCDGYSDDSPELAVGEEAWIDSQTPGTVVFIGVSSEKGTFFEGEINLTQPFDVTKLEVCYDEFDGNEIASSVSYDGEDIDNNGPNTNGKGSDFGFYIAGSNMNGSGYQRYKDMDDIKYKLTPWFPSKTNPEKIGMYNVQTREGHEYHAMWTGELWHNSWDDEKKPIKIKQWQGVAYDPDEHFLREELDSILEDIKFYE